MAKYQVLATCFILLLNLGTLLATKPACDCSSNPPPPPSKSPKCPPPPSSPSPKPPTHPVKPHPPKAPTPVKPHPPKAPTPVKPHPPKAPTPVKPHPPKAPTPVMPQPPKAPTPVMPQPPKSPTPVMPQPPNTPTPVMPQPPTSPTPPNQPTCPIDALKLGACVDVLGGLINIGLGDSAKEKCCPLLQGLADLDAAVCLCTAIRLKALNLINLLVPISLQVLANDCGKNAPSGFQCPA